MRSTPEFRGKPVQILLFALMGPSVEKESCFLGFGPNYQQTARMIQTIATHAARFSEHRRGKNGSDNVLAVELADGKFCRSQCRERCENPQIPKLR